MRAAVVRQSGEPLVIDARTEDPATVLQAHGGAAVTVGLAVDDKSFSAAYTGLRRGGRLSLPGVPRRVLARRPRLTVVAVVTIIPGRERP